MWEFRRRPEDLSPEDKEKLEGLFGKLPKLRFLELAQIAGRVDQIQQRGLGLNGHANTPSYQPRGRGGLIGK